MPNAGGDLILGVAAGLLFFLEKCIVGANVKWGCFTKEQLIG